MSAERTFMLSEIDQFRVGIPKIIRAVFRGEPVDPAIRIVGMGAEGAKRLCWPIAPEQLDRIHRCTSVKTQSAEIVCHDDLLSETTGVLTFHVSYAFEGTEPSGQPLSIREQGWIFVHCSVVKNLPFITGVEGYPHDAPLPDKAPTPSSELPPSPRKARERLLRRTASDEAKGCCWEGLWDMLLELLFGWF